MIDPEDETRITPSDDENNASSDAETLAIGNRRESSPPKSLIAHYLLEREIGRGGQGAVFLARDRKLMRPVALKVLSAQFGHSPTARMRFQREAEIASRLDHPGICTVYEAGEDEGTPYIAMRYVEGAPLDQKLREARAAREGSGESQGRGIALTDESRNESELDDLNRTLSFFVKTLDALQVAHEAGLVHRDIKPGNIMVTKAGEPVILDFGLARLDDGENPTLTQTGDVLGTPAYMSPEQVSKSPKGLDLRTDVYSMTVALYECLTLRRPQEAETREKLYQAILLEEAPDPRRFNSRLSLDLKVVLERGLEKDPDRRYASAAALGEDLQTVIEGRPVSAKPISNLGRLWRWCRRRPAPAALIGVSALTALIIVGLSLFMLGRQPLVDKARQDRAREHVDAQLEKAYLMLETGRKDEALSILEKARLEGRIVPEALAGLLADLVERRKHKEALDLLAEEPATRRGTVGRSLVRQYCEDRLRGMSEQEAINATASIKPLDEVDCFLFSMREEAMAERDMAGASQRARDLMHQAVLRAESSRPLYHFRLIKLAAIAGDEGLVEKMISAITERWPADASSHYWAAWARWRLGKPDLAKPHLEEALTRNEKFAAAHVLMAAVLFDLKDPEGVQRHLDRAMALDPKDAVSRTARGNSLKSEGNIDAAIDYYRESLKIDPHQDDTWYSLGECLWERGDRQPAIESYEKACEIDPDYAPFFGRLAEARGLTGNVEGAADAAERCVAVDPNFAANRVEFWIEGGLTTTPLAAVDALLKAHPELRDNEDVGELTRLGLLVMTSHGQGHDGAELSNKARRKNIGAARGLLSDFLKAWEKEAEGSARQKRQLRRLLKKVTSHPAFSLIETKQLETAHGEEEAARWQPLLTRLKGLKAGLED